MHDLRLRPATIDDVPAICDLVNRAERGDGVQRVLELEELFEELGREAFDLATDSCLASRTRSRWPGDATRITRRAGR